MAQQIAIIKEALGSLPYPMKGSALEAKFTSLLKSLPKGIKRAEVSEVMRAFEYSRSVNISFISALLRERCPKLLVKSRKRWTHPVKFSQLKATRAEVELKLLRTAGDYVDLTFDNSPGLKVREIVESELRNMLAEFLREKDALALLTPEAVQEVYMCCADHFVGKTQAQIKALGCCSVLRPCIESAFDNLLDMQSLPRVFHEKLITRLLKYHFQSIQQQAKHTFKTELESCIDGKAMDWNVEGDSAKGSHLFYVAQVAREEQPDAQFANESLRRVIEWERYPTATEIDLRWQPLLEAVCRLYIGLLALSSNDINCHPEVYLWMRRVLRKVYQYPRESAYYENRLLNVFNECAARYLKRRRCFLQNLRYYPSKTEMEPYSCQDSEFLQCVCESVEFRYLSDSPSLSTMLHVAESNDEFVCDNWPLGTGLDVSKDMLLWRESKLPSEQEIQIASYSDFLPLSLLSGWYLTVPKALCVAADFIASMQLSIQQKQRKAKCIGAFLGLLIVRRYITNRFLSLFGFCLGAKIVLSCLAEIAEFNRRNPPASHVYITDVILLAGVADAETIDWELVTEAVRGRFINLHYPRSDLFNSLFGPKMQRPIGSKGIHRSGIEDVDISDVLAEEMALFKTTRKASDSFKKISKLVSYYP